MLTPKEKAKELICMFTFVETEYKKIGKRMIAKRCAKIAVEECLQTCVESSIYYWKEVLTEIEKL